MTRDRRIVIRVNQDEYEHINNYAKNKGYSVAEIIRSLHQGFTKKL